MIAVDADQHDQYAKPGGILAERMQNDPSQSDCQSAQVELANRDKTWHGATRRGRVEEPVFD